MATVIHELVSGGVIEYESTSELDAFLPRVLKLLKDPTKTEDDMVGVIYGPDNPILDKTLFPGVPGLGGTLPRRSSGYFGGQRLTVKP